MTASTVVIAALQRDGLEKFYRPVEWMRYVIDHFLHPGAIASRSGTAVLRRFHVRPLVQRRGGRRPTGHGEVFLIEVRDNSVTRRVLVPGVGEDWCGELAYEAEIDAQRARRRAGERRTSGTRGGRDSASRCDGRERMRRWRLTP